MTAQGRTLLKPMKHSPIERGRAYAGKVPGAVEGEGGDKHTFALACKLVKDFGLSGDEALAVLREWNYKCKPPWRDSALARKIRCAGQPCSSAGVEYGFSRWPAVDETRVADVCKNGVNLARLEEMNPCKLDGDSPHSEQIVDYLFPRNNPLLCCATDAYTFETKPREEWRGIESRQAYIVPSAMSARYGTTEEGNPSQRTKTNVGSRQHIVTEFDQGTTDQQAAILFHLSAFAPLVLVLHSGGKSLHGWFRCTGIDAEQVTKFFRYSVLLGADDQQHCACQLVRMPDGQRENGKRQRVVFFNPNGVLAE